MPKRRDKDDTFWEEHAKEHEREAGWLGNFLGLGAAANEECATCENEAYPKGRKKIEWW